MSFESQYLDLLRHVLAAGEDRHDRTGTGTRAVFGRTLSVDLAEGFPLLTTKHVPFRAVLGELLWFIEGSGDERRLAEILHGTRDPARKTIWSPNAERTTGASYTPRFQGDLGRIYGVQWRRWQSHRLLAAADSIEHPGGGTTYLGATVLVERHDQLQQVVDRLRHNPTDRRIILSAWNPGELDQMMLPPCHLLVQFYLSGTRQLSAQMYQRSADLGLGVPFNVASYSLLLHMVAHVIGATVGTLNIVMGDVHIYHNHLDAVKEQLRRHPRPLPVLRVTRPVATIDDFKMDDFEVTGYDPHPAIRMEMAA